MAEITPGQLAKWLSEVLGQRLKCVVLYGSAAAGDFVEGESNFNLLVIAEPLGVTELKGDGAAARGVGSGWARVAEALCAEQLAASLDAFPIEMLDIQQSRQVLSGEDLLATLRIEPVHLRLAIERELTGKLLGCGESTRWWPTGRPRCGS